MVARYLIHHGLVDPDAAALLHCETAEQRKPGNIG